MPHGLLKRWALAVFPQYTIYDPLGLGHKQQTFEFLRVRPPSQQQLSEQEGAEIYLRKA